MNQQQAIKYFIKLGKAKLGGRVVGLTGSLGVGKTHFVKTFVKLLDDESANQVNSPTYNICNIYELDELVIHHYDLYRIESEADLYNTGIYDSIENGSVLVFIEWVDLFKVLEVRCDELVVMKLETDDPSLVIINLVINT
jgi:tRNA threonylcarbamoyl adenosine modification protein YjeE